MKKRKIRDAEELSHALKHIVYELNMLKLVANALSSCISGKSVITNALVESFAIHTRNLIEFLWPDKPKNDHIIANDFFKDLNTWDGLQPEIPVLLKQSRIRAHKEIAHISYDRIKVKPEEKPWNYFDISKLISDNMSIFLAKKEI